MSRYGDLKLSLIKNINRFPDSIPVVIAVFDDVLEDLDYSDMRSLYESALGINPISDELLNELIRTIDLYQE